MDITNYIASGMIEGYLFGLATPEERAEFERRLKIEPELQDEYMKAQQMLKCYTACLAVRFPEDPESVWEKIQASPQPEKPETITQQGTTAPIPPTAAAEKPLPVSSREPEIPAEKIIKEIKPLAPTEETESLVSRSKTDTIVAPAGNRWKWIGLFGLLLFVGAVAMALSYKMDRDALEEQLNEQMTLQKEASAQLEKMQVAHLSDSVMLSFLNQHGVKVWKLSGEESFMLGWNSESGKLMIWDIHLPAPDAGKKYIFWALKDGKPQGKIVLNEFDHLGSFDLPLVIKQSEQFIVTLENEDVEKPDFEEIIAKTN